MAYGIKALFKTNGSAAALILRVIVGLVIIPHGSQKLLGWFGGYGFSGTMSMFTGKMHIPWALALLVIITEFFGSLGLILGFLTRVAAFGLTCLIVVAVWMVHWQNGFFMNWFGGQKGEGFEYHLLVIAISVSLMITGPGAWSVDGAIAKRLSAAP